MDQLLSTKFHIPRPQPELVPRPSLIGRLNEGLHRKLTLISAPAGFGKTTLVSEWMSTLGVASGAQKRARFRIAWLSLDEGDNDLTRFLAYLITALNRAAEIKSGLCKGVLSMLQSPQPPPAETVLTSLINELDAIPDRIILILDDFHNIDSTPVDDVLTFLLEHLPAQMHLVLVTRVDPQLSIARLRARRKLTELRAIDLRFSTSEATEFLNQAMGLSLSGEDIAALETRTEGWIAGLQLVAISIQGKKDPTSLIKSFTGSHRYILDYLIEEVLEQQSENVQAFLLQTAILNQLNGSLCDAITGQNDGQSTLEKLERANLFIVPLDQERHWYRYHQLFADLLRRRLRQTQADQIPELYRRASMWYTKNGFFSEAIEHSLLAEDFERAASLIEEHIDDSWAQGAHIKMRRWMFQLPVEWLAAKPYLCIFNAWYLFTSGQYDGAEQSLHWVEVALDPSSANASETKQQRVGSVDNYDRLKLQGRLAAVRAFMDAHRGDISGMILHADQALEYLPEQDRIWRSLIAIVLGDIQGFKGDMTAAYKARFEAWKACKAAGEPYYIMLAGMKLAITLRAQGHLQQTLEICQQQIQIAEDCGLSKTSLLGLLLAIRGEVLAELNDLDEALRQVKTGVKLAESGVDMSLRGWSYVSLMRVLFSRQDLAGIQKTIQKVQSIARETNVPAWVMNQMTSWQVRVWLLQGNLDAASQWSHERGLTTGSEKQLQQEINFFSLFDDLILARLMLAQGRLEEADSLLQNLLTVAETMGRTSLVIEIRILQALVAQAMGNTTASLQALEQALRLAEPEGFIRIFVDERQPLAGLLYEALSREIEPDYVRRLLVAFPIAESKQVDPSRSKAPEFELIEQLSEREVEVLQFIAEGLTNPEIADRLYLSLNTVKVHTRNIYGKLGVNNRTQAISRGKILGILPSA